MAIKFPDSDGFGNPGTPELSFENDIALEFTTDSASYSEYGDADHVAYTQTKRPFSLSQYFRNGNEVPDADANVNIPLIDNFPTAISFSDFYGAVNEITIEFIGQEYEINGTTYTANMNDTLNLFTIAELAAGSSPGNNITVPFVFKFDSDTVFNNSIQFGGTFSDITIENNGIIAGRGGHGEPLSPSAYTKINYGNGVTTHKGNAAIWIDSDQTKVEIINLEKGFIAGGGNQSQVGSTIASDTAPYRVYANGEASEGPASADGYQGYGGGWNGGRGGYARLVVSAAVEDGDGRTRSPNNGDGTIFDGGVGYFVTGRDIDISGANGVITNTVAAYARINSTNLLSNSEVQNFSGPTRAIGGSGLNGGEKGQAHALALNSGTGSASQPESIAIANSASGSGGGSGIGTSAIPYFQASPTQAQASNSNAGGGNSIQFKTGTTIGTSTMTNEGRVYGNTDITIS